MEPEYYIDIKDLAEGYAKLAKRLPEVEAERDALKTTLARYQAERERLRANVKWAIQALHARRFEWDEIASGLEQALGSDDPADSSG